MDYNFSKEEAQARLEIIEVVQALHNEKEKPEQAERIQIIQAILNAYISATGETPTDKTKSRMGDYLLIDDLLDKKKHLSEFPFQSESQQKSIKQRHPEISFDERIGGKH